MRKDEFLANNLAAQTLAKTGCITLSAAVALSNLGILINPAELNDGLTQNGGFTSCGCLILDAIENATGGKAKAYAYSTPERSDIDLCLKNNQYPVVKCLIGGVVQHWVAIVGKEDALILFVTPLLQPLNRRLFIGAHRLFCGLLHGPDRQREKNSLISQNTALQTPDKLP